jgi:hypothetical protein
MFAVIILTIMIMLITTGCAVKEAVPEVTEGRFDFSATYELNGVEKTYSGVYVCKYKGIYVTFVGSSRMWDGYIEDSDYDTTIAIQHTDDNCTIYIDFGLYPEYFMADPDYVDYKPETNLYVEYVNDETGEFFLITDEKEIFEKFGVKLISYHYADPIDNNYTSKWSYGHFEPGIN